MLEWILKLKIALKFKIALFIEYNFEKPTPLPEFYQTIAYQEGLGLEKPSHKRDSILHHFHVLSLTTCLFVSCRLFTQVYCRVGHQLHSPEQGALHNVLQIVLFTIYGFSWFESGALGTKSQNLHNFRVTTDMTAVTER